MEFYDSTNVIVGNNEAKKALVGNTTVWDRVTAGGKIPISPNAKDSEVGMVAHLQTMSAWRRDDRYISAGENMTVVRRSNGLVCAIGKYSSGNLGYANGTSDCLKLNPMRFGEEQSEPFYNWNETVGTYYSYYTQPADSLCGTYNNGIAQGITTDTLTYSSNPSKTNYWNYRGGIFLANWRLACGKNTTAVQLGCRTHLTGDNLQGTIRQKLEPSMTSVPYVSTVEGSYGELDDYGINARIALGDDHAYFITHYTMFRNSYPWAIDRGLEGGTGGNSWGQLGDGSTTNSASWTPVQTNNWMADWDHDTIPANTTIVARFPVDCCAGANNTYRMWSDGEIDATGQGTFGQNAQLSTANINVFSPMKETASGITTKDWRKIRAGGYHVIALKSDGTVWSCGRNDHGQLGINNSNIAQREYLTPVLDSNNNPITDIVDIACGRNTSFFVRSDGHLLACGDNSSGQLGLGGAVNGFTPFASAYAEHVRMADGSHLMDVFQVIAGFTHTIAIQSNGNILGWGSNSYGEALLPLNITQADNPTQTIPGVIDTNQADYRFTSYDLGEKHSIYLKDDGTVWTAGENTYNQLGDTNLDTTAKRPFLSQVSQPSDIIQVACGAFHNVLLRSNGTVLTFGRNNLGQLGDGTTTDSATPVYVLGNNGEELRDIVEIKCGEYHTVARSSDNKLYIWGLARGFWSVTTNSANWVSGEEAVFYTNASQMLIDSVEVNGFVGLAWSPQAHMALVNYECGAVGTMVSFRNTWDVSQTVGAPDTYAHYHFFAGLWSNKGDDISAGFMASQATDPQTSVHFTRQGFKRWELPPGTTNTNTIPIQNNGLDGPSFTPDYSSYSMNKFWDGVDRKPGKLLATSDFYVNFQSGSKSLDDSHLNAGLKGTRKGVIKTGDTGTWAHSDLTTQAISKVSAQESINFYLDQGDIKYEGNGTGLLPKSPIFPYNESGQTEVFLYESRGFSTAELTRSPVYPYLYGAGSDPIIDLKTGKNFLVYRIEYGGRFFVSSDGLNCGASNGLADALKLNKSIKSISPSNSGPWSYHSWLFSWPQQGYPVTSEKIETRDDIAWNITWIS